MSRSLRLLAITAILVVGSLLPARALGALDPPVPDGQIRASDGQYLGNDIYNSDGDGQHVYRPRAPKTVFYVEIQNDGTPGRFKVKGTDSVGAAGSTGAVFSVKYRAANGNDITAAVIAGTYQTRRLLYHQTQVIKVILHECCGQPFTALYNGSVTASFRIDAQYHWQDKVKFSVGAVGH